MNSCIFCARLTILPQWQKEALNEIISDALKQVGIEANTYLVLVPRPIRLFIVDDEAGIRKSLQGIIQTDDSLSVNITMAGTGKTALDLIRHNDFDLLFIDMRLPDNLTGLDILRYAKLKDPKSACYILTGLATVGQLEEAAHLGAIEVIAKPINPRQIISIIKEHQETL